MPIIYHAQSQTFHLYNAQISYIFTVLSDGHLAQLYYGARIHDREGLDDLQDTVLTDRPEAPDIVELDQLRQEYPDFGRGDMHVPAFELRQPDGSTVTDFVYATHQISAGKPKLAGLPATYVDHADEATTLEVTLADAVTQAQLVLVYTIYEGLPVITRSARFEASTQPLVVERAMSMSIDLPDQDYQMVELTGAWARERHITTQPVAPGIQAIQSLRGHSSAQFNPFIALQRPTTTEDSGVVMGFCLVYSGNFLAQVEADTMAKMRVSLGIHPDHFAWRLDQDGALQTPEVVMVYATQGRNQMSQVYHQLFASRLVRGKYRQQVRPILINNWEATYFDFDTQKLLAIAETASRVGIELFVLDDGWFGARSDDHRGLGDWQVNIQKLPGGLAALATAINDLGMQFGLWFEPEMVNADSDLFRTHPDWILKAPQRVATVGRNQYVLDMSKQEVVDDLFAQMSAVLHSAPISYVKWDMNRSLSTVYSQGQGEQAQGALYHRFILGVYALYERLRTEFPDILFESCASGGARFDAGMLYYAPQAWTSDDTDAVERQKIQYGTSLVYPLSSMGSHVSAVPNEQVSRDTPLETRANVAYFGTFGYELDLNRLSAAELQQVAAQVAFMKANRELIQNGRFYRLQSPFAGDDTAWMVVSPDRRQALVGYYRNYAHPSLPAARYLPLQGLDPQSAYQVDDLANLHYGDELMNAGLVVHLPDAKAGDFQSWLYKLEAK